MSNNSKYSDFDLSTEFLFKPRLLIGKLDDNYKEAAIIIIFLIAGFVRALNRAAFLSLGNTKSLEGIIFQSILFGSIGGLIGYYIFSFLVEVVGNLLGGKAKRNQIKSVVAWSKIPILLSLIIWIPKMIIFGNDLFTSQSPEVVFSTGSSIASIIFYLIDLLLSIWSICLFIIALSEIQRFSISKSILNGSIALGIPVILIILLRIIL